MIPRHDIISTPTHRVSEALSTLSFQAPISNCFCKFEHVKMVMKNKRASEAIDMFLYLWIYYRKCYANQLMDANSTWWTSLFDWVRFDADDLELLLVDRLISVGFCASISEISMRNAIALLNQSITTSPVDWESFSEGWYISFSKCSFHGCRWVFDSSILESPGCWFI